MAKKELISKVRAYSSKKIRDNRKRMGWTQEELGNKVGVKFNTISGWENGVSEPEQDQLFQMAFLFGISINELFPPTVFHENTFCSTQEKILLSNFQRLNSEGKRKLSDYAEDLVVGGRYGNEEKENPKGA